MYVYDAISPNHAHLGAVDLAITTPADGIPRLGTAASNALALLLSARYPQQTGSGKIVNGQAVTMPGLDPTADYQTLVASQANPGGATPAPTVLDQLNSLPSGYVALFDAYSVQSNLSGTPSDIGYAIAKPEAARVLASQGAMAAMTAGAAGGGAGEGEAPKFSVVVPIVGAGIGLLVGGPVGAAVGAGAGLVVEYFRTQKTAKAA